MPSRAFHNWAAINLLGVPPDVADFINRHMDAPAKQLGPRHRIVRHDIAYALRMASRADQIGVRENRRVRPARPDEVFRAYGTHVMLDAMTEINPTVRRILKTIEAFNFG